MFKGLSEASFEIIDAKQDHLKLWQLGEQWRVIKRRNNVNNGYRMMLYSDIIVTLSSCLCRL